MSAKSYLDDITLAVGNTPLVRIRNLTAQRGIKATVLPIDSSSAATLDA